MAINSNLGQRIKELRISKGYSQELLASKTDLNIRTIQRIESGESVPRGDTLNRLSEVLDVSLDEIILNNERMKNIQIEKLIDVLIKFSASIIILGALFKIMHWPFADLMVKIGLLSGFMLGSYEISRLKKVIKLLEQKNS